MRLRQTYKDLFFLGFLSIVLVFLPIFSAVYFVNKTPAVSLTDYLNSSSNPNSPGRTDDSLTSNRLKKILGLKAPFSKSVPRQFSASLPSGLPLLENTKDKKRQFTMTLLPIILKANEEILKDRSRALAVKIKFQQDGKVSLRDKKWLKKKSRDYKLKAPQNINTDFIDSLLMRLDIIPASLALAQAAMESGWGTSHFSQNGNALFGEWVWGDEEGMLPRARESGKTHRIKKFDRLFDSVMSYMRNLNRHPSYQALRNRRAELHKHNLPITGSALAPSLIHYSERGAAYVNDILSIINFNGFEGLDNAALAVS